MALTIIYQDYDKDFKTQNKIDCFIIILFAILMGYLGYQFGLHNPDFFKEEIENKALAGMTVSILFSLVNILFIIGSNLDNVNYLGRKTLSNFVNRKLNAWFRTKKIKERFKKSKNMSFERKCEHILLNNYQNLFKSNKIIQAEKELSEAKFSQKIKDTPYTLYLNVRAWEKYMDNMVILSVKRDGDSSKYPFYQINLSASNNEKSVITQIKQHKEDPIPFKEDLDIIVHHAELFVKSFLPEGYYQPLESQTSLKEEARENSEQKTSKASEDNIQKFFNQSVKKSNMTEWQKDKINKIEKIIASFKEAIDYNLNLDEEYKIINEYLIPEAMKMINLYPLQEKKNQKIAEEINKTTDDYIERIEKTVQKAIDQSTNDMLTGSKINLSVHDYTHNYTE